MVQVVTTKMRPQTAVPAQLGAVLFYVLLYDSNCNQLDYTHDKYDGTGSVCAQLRQSTLVECHPLVFAVCMYTDYAVTYNTHGIVLLVMTAVRGICALQAQIIL